LWKWKQRRFYFGQGNIYLVEGEEVDVFLRELGRSAERK